MGIKAIIRNTMTRARAAVTSKPGPAPTGQGTAVPAPRAATWETAPRRAPQLRSNQGIPAAAARALGHVRAEPTFTLDPAHARRQQDAWAAQAQAAAAGTEAAPGN